MNFTELLAAARAHPDAVSVPADWAQGRAVFGGLMAAMLHEAMRLKLADDRPVRSLAITFVGPAAPEVPISLEVEVLREGKAVSTLLGRAVQNGQVVTLVQGSFGAGRPSVVAVEALPAAALKPLEQAAPELPFIKGSHRSSCVMWPCAGPWAGCRSVAMRHARWAAGCACAMSPKRRRRLLTCWPWWTPGPQPAAAPQAACGWQYAYLDHRVHPARTGAVDFGLVPLRSGNPTCPRWLRACGCGAVDRRRELVALSRQTVTVFA